jgi:hypothetical protein
LFKASPYDILVTGETVDESLENLQQVLKRLDDAGLRLKKDKCVFMAKEVIYIVPWSQN